jgi:hypothetical protein
MVYNPKVSTLEDKEDINKLTLDELYGILIAYELRIGRENHSNKETTFKVLKKTEDQKSKLQSSSQEESYDEEESNFIKKLQKGLGKYKGKLPFKCFNYGKVGHFQNKCPYPKMDYEDERTIDKTFKKRERPFYNKNHYKGKKISTLKIKRVAQMNPVIMMKKKLSF